MVAKARQDPSDKSRVRQSSPHPIAPDPRRPLLSSRHPWLLGLFPASVQPHSLSLILANVPQLMGTCRAQHNPTHLPKGPHRRTGFHLFDPL